MADRAVALAPCTAILPWLLPSDAHGSLLILDRENIIDRNTLFWQGPVVHVTEFPTTGMDTLFHGIVEVSASKPCALIDLRALLEPDGFHLRIGPNRIAGCREQWGLFVDRTHRTRLIRLSSNADIVSCRHLFPGRTKQLPAFLLRRRVEPFACLWTNASAMGTRLDQAIAVAGPDHRIVVPGMIQEKDKFTIEMLNPLGRSSFLKLPLSRRADEDLDKAAAMIRALRQHLDSDDPLRLLIPQTPTVFEFEGRRGWLENGCVGKPLAEIKEPGDALAAFEHACTLIRALKNVNADALPPLLIDHGEELRSHLANRIQGAPDILRDAFQTILLGLRRFDGDVHLRKGDMTLSNILVEGREVKGLIDWDDCGLTRQPLADLADLVLSWTWRKEGMSRAQAIAWLLGPTTQVLTSGFDLDRLLDLAGGDRRSFQLAVLQSWLDHAHNELIHPRASGRPDRIRTLLIEPLAILEPLLPCLLD